MKRKSEDPEIAGILPVIKNPGPTSHDVVQVARRMLRLRQIGHTGTLDPAAAGLLVLCLGPYTKLVPYMTETGKVYRGHMVLGIETDTDDSEGRPVASGDPSNFTIAAIRETAARFTGDILQAPPRYAAIKVAGKKLYEYARAGEKVEIEPRAVTVHRFDIISIEDMDLPVEMRQRAEAAAAAGTIRHVPPRLKKIEFSSSVSSGTYVRALARDVGHTLGCGGYLLSLFREAVGQFTAGQAMPMELLESDPVRAHDYLVRGAATLDPSIYPILTLTRGFTGRLTSGQPLNERMMDNPAVASAVPDGATCAISSDDGTLLAMVEARRTDSLHVPAAVDTRFSVHFRPVRIFPCGLR